MPRKKSPKSDKKLVDLHVYGILDTRKHIVTKISLDPSEIQAEIALMGGLPKDFIECDFRVKLKI
jgi:hypothetical protein